VKRNAFEFALSLHAENVQITLPQNLYSTSPHAPTLRVYEVQLEARSVLQYLDFFLCLSPVTITIPVPSASGAGATGGVGGASSVGAPSGGSASGAGPGTQDRLGLGGGGSDLDFWNEKETYISITGLIALTFIS
jgi:hypothetical protein